MAFQPVPDCYELVAHYSMNAQQCVNTFYATVDPSVYDQATGFGILAEFAAWCASDFLPILPGGVVWTKASVRGLAYANDYYGESSISGGDPGGTGTGNLSGNVAFAIKRQSGLTGRSARGRVYLPVPTSALATDENQVTSTWATAAANALDELRVMLDSAGATEAIVSRRANGALRPVGLTFPVLNYTVSDLFVDSMRRRLTNRGS